MNALATKAIEIYDRKPEKMNYFQVSVKLIDNKNGFLSVFTRWVGRDKGHELREADLVIPEAVCEDFKERFKQNISVLHDPADLKAFVSLGGHALISEDLIKDHWPELSEPKIAVRVGLTERYMEYNSLAAKYLQRFPKGDFRMQILHRDHYRCRVCGKHADDNIDLRLEIHHIQPWSEGGLTHEGNLITLCKVCHEGSAAIDRDFLFSKVHVAMPDLGPQFFDSDAYSGAIRHKMMFYDSNAVTMRLPKIKKL